MSGDSFLRYPRKDASERARLRDALHHGEHEYSRYHNPRPRFPFGGLFAGCLQLIVIGLICGLVTTCVVSYLLMFALK